MGWLASIAVGVVTAIATLLAAGYVANLAAGWYRVSSFEGASGYFVVGLALLGLLGGMIIGIVTARVVAAGAQPGFLRALAVALAVSLGTVGLVGGVARLGADVGPTSGGEALSLSVELRWPAGVELPPAGSGEWFLRLGALSGQTMRTSRTGPLWREDARREDGRWIVPGAVDLFTSRGKRVIDVVPQGVIPGGFIVPVPARPGPDQIEWSEWLPRDSADGITYRYRVLPESRPIRTETVGPFQIATLVHSLGEMTSGNQPPRWTADAEFLVRHRGEPLIIEHRDSSGTVQQLDRVSAVATVASLAPALMVQVEQRQEHGACYLVVSEPGRVRVEPAGPCSSPRMQIAPLTNDTTVFRRALEERLPAGRFDRVSFTGSRYYLLDENVLDSENLSLRPWSDRDLQNVIERIPPVGVAPDGQSFARLAWGESSEELALAVTRLDGEAYRVPIDRARMRMAEVEQIDPAWVLHHFEWQRTPNGSDRLVERTNFTPLPWHGTLTIDHGYREYRVSPALPGLRPALIDLLVETMGAERVPAEEGAFSHEVRIDGATVNVSFSERDGHVGVWMDHGVDSRLVATIAQRFDAALATHRYDHLFAR
jgi:hypothetical protein